MVIEIVKLRRRQNLTRFAVFVNGEYMRTANDLCRIAFSVSSYIGDATTPSISGWCDREKLASYFGVSVRTIGRWRAEGMPAKKTENGYIYDLGAVDRWRRSRKNPKNRKGVK